MRSFSRLLLLFLAVPLAELALLVWIGGRVGLFPTLALIVATAVAGSWLMRREGRGAWRRLQARLGAGQLPTREALDGLIVLVAGVLLLTPGVLTDVAGLLGLLPPTRAWIARRLEARFAREIAAGRIRTFASTPFGPATRPIEDAEVVEDYRTTVTRRTTDRPPDVRRTT